MKQPTCNLGQIVFIVWAVLICLPASVQAQYTIQAGDRVALEWNYNTSNGASNARNINNCNVAGERRPGQEGIARSSRTCVSLSGWNIEGWYFVNNSPEYGTTWTAERLSDGYRLLYPMPGIGAWPNVSTGNRSWRVRIFNDISVPVCSSPGGSIQGYKYLGSMGWTLPDQPVSTSSAVWWRVRWDDGTIGWSPDSVAVSAYGNRPGVYFAWYNRETRNFQQGCLSVSPSDGLTSSGPQGGPFSPFSKNYTLTNTGELNLNWSVSVNCNWVSVSQSSGTLSPGQSTTVRVSLNDNANSLPPGPYTCTVRFTNTTNDCGSATREVRLTVGQSQQPPREAPTLRSPRHRAAGVSIQPTFEWSPVAGATRYGLYIKDVASGQLVFDSDQLNSPITGTSYTLPQNLEPGRLYRWNMRAGNEAGWGPFSEAADFFTVHPQPPADLAVGIDVSSYSGPISVEQFQALRSLGYEFVIVQAWGGTARNPHASSQIANALRAGMQVAAYCLLKYDPTPNGAQQVDEAIRAIGNDLIRNLSFLAIDVELPQDWRLEANPTQRIDNAIRRVREWNLRHVIYTSENNWIRITNNSVEFNGIPLWEARWPNVVNWGFFREQPRFGGWSRRVGWQFQGDVYLTTTEPYNLLVDLNVFDRSFLSGDWQPEPEDESLSTLRLPFERGTFWYVHTYRLSGFVHDPDGCEYAADFYLASAQQANACSRQGNGQDQPIYAAHSGSHYVSIKVFNGKPYYSITVESDNFMTVYVHADIERDGRGIGGSVGSSITVDMLRNRLMRVYPTARSQGNDRYYIGRVRRGERIGYVDMLGQADSGPHLHFMAYARQQDGSWKKVRLDNLGPVRMDGEVILDRNATCGWRELCGTIGIYSYKAMPRLGYGGGGTESPTLLFPSDGAWVSTRPRLRIRHVIGDIEYQQPIQYRIELRDLQGNLVAYYDQRESTIGWDKPSYQSGEIATFQIPSRLAEGVYRWKAISYIGEAALSSEERRFIASELVPDMLTGMGTFTLSQAPSGLDSEPFPLPLEVQSRVWRNDAYMELVNTPIKIGDACWYRTEFPVSLDLEVFPYGEESFTLRLQRGWNLIGSPYLQEIPWRLDSVQVRLGSETKSLAAARDAGWVEDYLWAWRQDVQDSSKGRYVLVYDTGVIREAIGYLSPWRGYWLYAHQECELILRSPQRTRAIYSSAASTTGNWSLKISVETQKDSAEVMIGVLQERAITTNLPPPPPLTRNRANASLKRGDIDLGVDIRRRSNQREVWELVVEIPPDQKGSDVTLRWNSALLPRSAGLVLIDIKNNVRRNMKAANHYTFRPDSAGLYYFRIEMLPTSHILRILNPQVVNTRGGQYTLRFDLTSAASVNIVIEDGRGRQLRILESSRSRSAGTHTAVWDGRDQQGIKLPPGQYMLSIQAVSEDGQVARAVVPLIVTR
jgi:GH25 family lysozyme M1 (1,4-beta-N-acetylmuramidase)